MKTRSLRTLPASLVVCMAPLIACTSVYGAIVNFNESNATGVWALPAGTNLLNGATATPPPQQPIHGNTDLTSDTWVTATNGILGAAGDKLESVAPNNGNTVTFPLDITFNENGYNLTQFDAYGLWPDSGRDNLDFRVQYSTVDAPTVFVDLADIVNHTATPNNSTHTRLTEGATGILATRVHSVKFIFGTPNPQENTWVGYREFIALGTPVPLTDPLTWSGGTVPVATATWANVTDTNWKKTTGGAGAPYNVKAALTFDNSGINRNINVPAEIAASSLTFTNTNTPAYTISGEMITLGNNLQSSGSGTVTVNSPVKAPTGIALTGTGSLTLGGSLDTPNVSVSGTGSLSLNASNPLLVGRTVVSSGTLNVNDDLALEKSSLLLSGGNVNFKTGAGVVSSITGAGGTISLGNTADPAETILFVGNQNSTVTAFSGSIINATGDVGSLTKAGNSTLILSGANNYTGNTSVTGGILEFQTKASFYNGTPTAANGKFTVDASTVNFRTGGVGEFLEADVNAIDLSGFTDSGILGLNVTTGTITASRNFTQPLTLQKSGEGTLKLTGANTHTGGTKVFNGTIDAANATGVSIPGNVLMGDGSSNVFLNMGFANQFGPTSVVTMATLAGQVNAKLQLRGHDQTVAGLVSSTVNRVSLIQNDEIGTPGYTTPPGPATLTINNTESYSFAGLIRNQEGGIVSLIKNGVGTQELRNLPIASYNFTGPTTINAGILKLNFANASSGWVSNVTINPPGKFELTSENGMNWNFFRTVSGAGVVVKSGPGMISLANVDGYPNANKYTGGTIIEGGILKFYSNGPSTGEGNAAGQFCVAGPLDPANIITVKNGATMGVGGTAPMGQSGLLPQFAPTIRVEPGGRLWGGDGTNIAFVANVNLDGANVEITTGSIDGSFNTNLALVGTVVVGGTSTTPCLISTTGTGPNANMSLGSLGLPGTVFQVANVTANSSVDLTISSMLRNVSTVPSPLTKTGPGTLFLQGGKSYTGATTVTEGELRMDTASLADVADVNIAATGVLYLLHSDEDTISKLFLGGTQVVPGIYGSTLNSTPGIIKTDRIKGDGLLKVTTGVVTDGYVAWAAVIPNEADRGRAADPDGDGFTNLQEYLLGTSPIGSNGALTQVEKTPAGLIVRWSQRLTGGTYVLQESTTLAENPWPTSTVVPVNAADQTGLYSADYVRKEAVIPVDSARKFVRVKASE